MCGIAGILRLKDALPPPSRASLEAMAGALRHRGPDEFGLYRDATAGLAHARLSIIDLATGQQPLSNEDGTLWVSFNGEIFNYVELRAQLLAAGHTFRTQSDTEVIVHAYEQWGDDAFTRFNGQWAVALWDSRRKSLVLSRDKLGKRPLFMCEHQGTLHFASEVKALFAGDASIPRAVDPIGLDETFTFWASVAPQSVFVGVEELRPGTTRTYRAGTVHDVENFRPRFPVGGGDEFEGSLEDATAAVREALMNATKLRMLRADVPVGSYLSGGLDSSLVASLGLEAKGAKFSTFSLRFADAEFDETAYQRRMAHELGSEHHEVEVSRADIADCFRDVVFHAERPLLRTAPAPMFLLSRLVRQSGIKVVLTGEGADEIFAGYDIFREARVRRFWARQPQSKVRPLLFDRLYPYLKRSPVAQRAVAQAFFGRDLARWREPGFSHQPRWQAAAAVKRLFSPSVREAAGQVDTTQRLLRSLPPEFKDWSFLAQDQYLEMRTLLSSYLLSSQGDRMLMGNSVEGRFPFLDSDVIALGASLPPRFKLAGLDEKHVLKRAALGRVPSDILERKKQPYRAPDATAFLGKDVPAWVEDCFSSASLRDAGLFDERTAQQLWTKVRAQGEGGTFSNADNMAVVGVLSSQLLHADFVKNRPTAGTRTSFKTVKDVLPEAG